MLFPTAIWNRIGRGCVHLGGWALRRRTDVWKGSVFDGICSEADAGCLGAVCGAPKTSKPQDRAPEGKANVRGREGKDTG